MSLSKLTSNFIGQALPKIASGVGYVMITAWLVLSTASSALKITAFFLGVNACS